MRTARRCCSATRSANRSRAASRAPETTSALMSAATIESFDSGVVRTGAPGTGGTTARRGGVLAIYTVGQGSCLPRFNNLDNPLTLKSYGVFSFTTIPQDDSGGRRVWRRLWADLTRFGFGRYDHVFSRHP